MQVPAGKAQAAEYTSRSHGRRERASRMGAIIILDGRGKPG